MNRKGIQLPDMAVNALRALPSYGHHEYVFPAKAQPTVSEAISRSRTPGI